MIFLTKNWPVKEVRHLPWNYLEFEGIKNSFCIKGIEDFSNKFGSKIDNIKRALIWNENDLFLDTGEDFYYVLSLLPNNLIKRIKNQDKIDVMLENIYNKNTEHYKYLFPY